jgi:hypothetical protein
MKTAFKTINEVTVLKNDGSSIPFDPANSDYQAYLKWLDGYELQEGGWVKTSEGNTPEPAEGAE